MKKFQIDKYGIILFLTGFSALVYEIVFIKTQSLFLGQSIYAFSVMLAAFMFGIGIGSIYSIKLNGEPLWLFSLTQIGIAAYSILFIPLLNKMSVPSFLIAQLPFYLQNISLIMLSLAMLIVPTSLMGLSFPLMLRHVIKEKGDKRTIGQLFAYNTMGGLLGSLAAGFILLPMLGVSASLIIAAVINLGVASIIKTKHFSRRITTTLILLALVITINPEIDPHSVGSFYNPNYYKTLEGFISSIEKSRETGEILYSDFNVYGHVFVLKFGPYKLLYINGKPDGGTSQDVTTELLIGYIPMLLHENPKNVAVVGLGAGLTVGATLQFEAEKVDVYEINPGVVEANKYFEEENYHALSNPKSSLIMGDARRNLKLSEEMYDVIISEPSNPWIEGEGFLFTKEYYEIVDERLNENGIFVQWIGAYDYTEEDFNISLNTMHTIFQHIQIWSDGIDFYFIASREPKKFSFTKTLKEMQNPTIKNDFESFGKNWSKNLNPEDIFFSFFVADYKETGEKRINTDDNSIIEFSTAKNTSEASNHMQRLANKQMRVLPINLKKDDLEIEFITELPFYDSKYSIIKAGKEKVISKQLIYKDNENTLFIQTTTQAEMPTLAQAEVLAGNFKATIKKSKKNLYVFEGENSNGVIGYCPAVKKSFLGYTTTKESINIVCKEITED